MNDKLSPLSSGGDNMQESNVYSQGAGSYGLLGGGDLGGFLLGALLTGDGFGRRNDCSDVKTYQEGVIDGTTAKYSDVVAAVNNIDQNLNSGFDRIANVSRTGSETVLASLGGVKDAVQNVQFQNALQGKDIEAGFCSVKEAIHMDGEKTRTQIMENRYADLETKLNETSRERDLLATGNFPIGRPAHVDFWQGNAPASNDINIINQNVNAIGSLVGQVAKQVETTAQEVATLRASK